MLEEKFVVGYSGNLGRAHEFQTVLDAAERLRDRDHVVFLFLGGGQLSTALKEAVASQGLCDRLQFRPYQVRNCYRNRLRCRMRTGFRLPRKWKH